MMARAGPALLVLLLSVCAAATATVPLSPVIIVPGDGGSQLEARADKPSTKHFYCEKKFDWDTIWLNVPSLLPPALNCWCDNIRLVFDPATNTSVNSPGVETRVIGFGNATAVEWLSPSLHVSATQYMAPVVQALRSAGLTGPKSIRAAPYDFRHTVQRPMPATLLSDMGKLVEDTYAANGNRSVTLLAHSMGCPYTLYWLLQQSAEWLGQYVHAFVPISGVWRGTAKILRLLASGDSEGLPQALVNPLTIRGEQRSYESNVWLMPNGWAPAGGAPFVTTAKRNYTGSAQDYSAFLTDIGFPTGNLVRAVIEPVALPAGPVHGVKTTCIHGTNVSTPERFVWPAGDFPDKQPTTISGNGDGTVNLVSLEACKGFAQATMVVPGQDHQGILSDATVLRAVVAILAQP